MNLVKSLRILFLVLISMPQVVAQGDTTSTYYFGHSLIIHQKQNDNQANIPFWLAEIEKATGDAALTSGAYRAGQFGATAIPPVHQWSFRFNSMNHGSSMYPGDEYPINEHDNVLLTYMNWEIIFDYGAQLGERQWSSFSNAVNNVETIFNWMDSNDPNANLYLFECWPKIETDYILGGGDRWELDTPEYAPNSTEWAAYLTYALGKSNDYWADLQDSLIQDRGFTDLKSIPSSMICAKLWEQGGLLDDFDVFDLFEDDGPHGKPSAYFLAAMVVYAAQHQETPLRPFTSHEQIDQRILDRYDQIAAFIMTELGNWNFPNGSSRVWFAGPDSEAPIQGGNLTTSNIDFNSATLNWDEATDNVRVTAYEIHIDGTLHTITQSNSFSLINLNCNTTYDNVQVRAVDANLNASNFISTSFTTAVCPTETEPPTIPTGLSIVRLNNNSAYITWNESADNYGVESYTLSINEGSVTTQENTTSTVSDLNCSQTYQIGVLATDINGNSSSMTSSPYTHTCVPEYTLTLTYDEDMGNVQVDPTPESTYQNGQLVETYEEGTTVTFYRYPGSGYQFGGYTGDLISTNDPSSFTINDDMNITANFSESTITSYHKGINQVKSLILYPNPATDLVKINGLTEGITWKVLDNLSIEILAGNSKEINTSVLKSGSYYISFSNGEILQLIKTK